jgi:hypothetical protein
VKFEQPDRRPLRSCIWAKGPFYTSPMSARGKFASTNGAIHPGEEFWNG